MTNAFVFSPVRQVKQWPAVIKVAGDGGKVTELEIYLDLNLLPTDKYMDKLSEGNKVLFDAILNTFSGINTPEGTPLKDTDENRALLYQHAPFTDALLHAYRAANTGEAARKN
ncbi:hypothetical protein [Shewanella algae]|jgi:hypothetical protein|uniref:hypothetical protein n=1 Tax=Shewanella algae TaxID=38313 RepID=UPI000F42CC8E|nr:hypothetical protein [Shewanella algae]AYV14327.1 hypothetical protein EEY24_16405 [Shewanella algae]